MKKFLILFILPVQLLAQPFTQTEIRRWQQQAKKTTIIRDHYGIPHVYGKTDADAVFGLLYAQCEDDFKRVELNYIEKLGRMSELYGEEHLYNDLYLKLIIDSADAVADYKKSAPWLKKLLEAFADGVNYYLYKNPSTKPALLTRFKPWYPLLWTDGSIGAISTGDVSEDDVKNLYSGKESSPGARANKVIENNSGSNGFAIAPARSASGNALLYINPHVTFYFRPEVHMVSETGLNAYGAVTWGQFFIYQGFNEHCGWMHTSSNVDVADMYREKIIQKKGRHFYEYNNTQRPVTTREINIRCRQADGTVTIKTFTGLFTHHGPVMAKIDGQYIAVKSNNRSLTSLVQSWERTKATGLADYKKNMSLKANTSNNTVFADNKGNIAYWHGNFIPKRNTSYNWSQPVDGSITATEWQGLHPPGESVHVFNPVNGWIQNCNSTPFTAAGEYSPKKENYPPYMAPDGENFRGLNAVRVLSREKTFTLETMIKAGYDRYLPAFEILMPVLVKTFDQRVLQSDSLYQILRGPIDSLRRWDYYSGENSVATTLAVEWGEKLSSAIRRVYINEGETDQVTNTRNFAAAASPNELLLPLREVVEDLERRFGRWEISWGTINRYQRVNGDTRQQFNDNLPSLPVGFASALWGMLPSYNSRYFADTRKRYGVSGNSFVCAVEFGKKVKAKSLLAGGESSDPASPHFTDQLQMYTEGTFKDVLFYKDDVQQYARRSYHPGD